ncbi:sugar transferase [Stieleria varia]|uniref:UDP-glucose:undecaprenyl-phosphate glucose-1-phosphate transferase n=1 Tax=Stieleria varia TaxID=2528005 RepID=A0A5C6A5K1_9BACT|nr:sugar transferase [Stieleria varia]TWT94660.1 UDP-glucose:undecaprenyl-phosphate glucose-1-phosphate transferase [Stieleria varia]
MLGALLRPLSGVWPVGNDGDSLLLTLTEFNREVSRERIRATRRSFPFCIVTIRLLGASRRRKGRNALIRILHRHLRITDQKADLGKHEFAVLLVDTPEMGGRSVLDRMSQLCDAANLAVQLSLRVHDPDGFRSDSDDHSGGSGGRRRVGDDGVAQWLRVDHAEVEVTAEKPMVSRSLSQGLAKRVVDIVGAGAGLIAASPVLITAMIAVKATSPGPIFFRQTREGRGGKPFTIYKFRSMVVDAEAKQAALRAESHRDGPAFKIKNDPRVTRVGHFLRASCIDELPQLINVLRGDMSLVGPRPLPWHESRACNRWHRRRLDVRPGMTCHWQINKAKAETFDDWMRMDLQYVDRNNFWQDLRLIFSTVLVPMTGRGGD